MNASNALRALFGLVSATACSAAFAAATLVIINNDAAGEGFNDPTAVAPVGSNTGTTLGQQRLNAFSYAANIWGAKLDSPQTINILANFDPLTCTATGAVLGSAGPRFIYSDFPGAILPGTWYHSALADKLANDDLAVTEDQPRVLVTSAPDSIRIWGMPVA